MQNKRLGVTKRVYDRNKSKKEVMNIYWAVTGVVCLGARKEAELS